MKDYNVNLQYSRDYMLIQDGNVLSRRLVDFPPTFGSICLQILDLMVSKKEFYSLKRLFQSRFRQNIREATTWMWKTVHPGWISNEET